MKTLIELIKDMQYLLVISTANMVSKLFPLIGSMIIGYNHGITIGIIWFVGLWILIRKFMYKCSLEPSILAKIARIEGFSVPLTTRDKNDVLLAHVKRICVKYEVDMNI